MESTNPISLLVLQPVDHPLQNNIAGRSNGLPMVAVVCLLLAALVLPTHSSTCLAATAETPSTKTSAPTAVSKQKDQRPNVIIILVDDMGFSDIGCYGGEIETPNLDKLAAGGVRFTQFYNCGRCCPTRASLMTGLHPHQVGIGHMTEPPEKPLGFEGPYQGFLNQDCMTIAQVLKSSGYRTMMTGKWHLGIHREDTYPMQRGFDHFYGGLSGAFNYFRPGGNRHIYEGNEVVPTDEDFYATDAFTDRAMEYIAESKSEESDQPFFLYLAYNAPHWPLNALPEDYQKYRGKYKQGWHELSAKRLAKQKSIGLFPEETQAAPIIGPAWDTLNDKQIDSLDAVMAAYAGCVDRVDQNVGRLIQFLKEQDEYENTLICFLSDNGACQEGGKMGNGGHKMVMNPPLETVDGVRLGLYWANACNTPFRKFKHFVHEGGACTPMIAHWPAGIPASQAGTFNRQFAYLPDFMATAVDLSGATYPDSMPELVGKTLLPTLKDGQQAVHNEPLFWEHEGNAAMRDGSWKLVRQYKQPWELFNLATDRTELDDQSAAQKERKQEMIKQWETWATKTQVKFPERFDMYQHLQQLKQEREAQQSQ